MALFSKNRPHGKRDSAITLQHLLSDLPIAAVSNDMNFSLKQGQKPQTNLRCQQGSGPS